MRIFLLLIFLFLLPFGLHLTYRRFTKREKQNLKEYITSPVVKNLAIMGVGLAILGIISMAIYQNYGGLPIYEPPTGVDSGFNAD